MLEINCCASVIIYRVLLNARVLSNAGSEYLDRSTILPIYQVLKISTLFFFISGFSSIFCLFLSIEIYYWQIYY